MSSLDQPALPAPHPTLRARIRLRWDRVRDWWSKTWSNIRPGPEATQGAMWAILAASVWAAVIGGLTL